MKELTKEEQEKLLESKYVQDVTSRFVYFSAEFKKLFYEEYKSGKKPKRILQELGIDTDILGQSRINVIRYHKYHL